MRLIYLLAADADASVVAEISALLEQRGYAVRRADERQSYPPAQPQEITLALWSGAVARSRRQVMFTNRALDAWTERRLIFARLDNTLLPRGFGDLETVDLTYATGRVAGVWKIVDAAQEIDRRIEQTRPEPGWDVRSAGPSANPYGSDAAGALQGDPADGGRPLYFSVSHGVIIGIVAGAALLSTGYIAMPQASGLLIGSAAMAWGLLVGAVTGRVAARMQSAPQPAVCVPAEETVRRVDGGHLLPAQETVFVSYARPDASAVYPMAEAIEATGRKVLISTNDLPESRTNADSIARAISESDTFCLICTAEAFQSDHVRRELFIAAKLKRKLLPLRLDFSAVPEDYQYFQIHRYWLDLTAIEPAEQTLRLQAALAR